MNYKETYQEWLSNPYFDEDTKKELTAIENDENEIKRTFFTQILHLVLLDFVESSVLVSTV